VGDVVLVRPGGHIPVDGVVVGGHSFVDQATITGESMPAEKTPGSRVFAGTMNQSGVLEIQADKIGRDTAFGRIIELVERAEHSRAPIEKIADRLAAVKDNILYMQVSVYAASEATHDELTGTKGKLPAVLNGLRLLCERGLNPYVFSCVTKANVGELPEIHRLATRLGAQGYRVATVVECGRAEDLQFVREQQALKAELLRIAKVLVDQWKNDHCIFVEADGRPVLGTYLNKVSGIHTYFQNCRAAITLAYIDESGQMAPCPFLGDLSLTKGLLQQFSELNIRRRSFSSIWKSAAFENFRKLHDPESNAEIRRDCGYFKKGQCIPCPVTPCGCFNMVRGYKRAESTDSATLSP